MSGAAVRTDVVCWCWEADWDLLLFEQRHNKITSLPPNTRPKLLRLLSWRHICCFSLQKKGEAERNNLGAPQGSFQILVSMVVHRHQCGSSSRRPLALSCTERLWTLDLGDGDGRMPQSTLCFPSIHFSLKPADIPSFLCCCNANLSAPFKSGRWEEEGGTERITAVWINAVLHMQRDRNKEICEHVCNYALFTTTRQRWQRQLGDVCFHSSKSQLNWKRGGREKRDRQIVLHLQYVSELVAMQQDWESVEVGGWEDGDSLVEREEGREEGGKERVNRRVLECKLEKGEVLRRDTTLYRPKGDPQRWSIHTEDISILIKMCLYQNIYWGIRQAVSPEETMVLRCQPGLWNQPESLLFH